MIAIRDDGVASRQAAPRVMLLSLWSAPGAGWHARLVEADAQVHDFDSPLQLARFLAAAGVPLTRDSGGLR